MWYVSGTGWQMEGGAAQHRYHIKYAESADGVGWRATDQVCIDYPGLHRGRLSAGHACARTETSTRMWYCARGEAYRLGYAESSDGLDWERMDEDVELGGATEGWDSEMQERASPFVFDHANERHLLYNGNGYGATGIGHATLSNG